MFYPSKLSLITLLVVVSCYQLLGVVIGIGRSQVVGRPRAGNKFLYTWIWRVRVEND
jgi:hypothetical protein